MLNFSTAADADDLWPGTYAPTGEDAEMPWLPTDPLPNPEPEAGGLNMPEPGIDVGESVPDLHLR